MIRLLFWNVKRKDPGRVLRELCASRDVDVVIIAEAWPSIATLGQELSAVGSGGFFDASGGSGRLSIFTRLAFSSFRPKADGHGIAIRNVNAPMVGEFLLAAVHLPSKLYYGTEDQLISAQTTVTLIRDVEKDVGHRRTLVIGDFNMDPFEQGMVAASGFHAAMDRRIANRKQRRIAGEAFPFFYNPMWSRLGDYSSGPPGTFKRAGSTYVEYFWRTFDQVLISPDLLGLVPDKNVEVVDSQGTHKFIDDSGRWRAPSDHLPLIVTIDSQAR
jgi:hypothetical protein